MIVLLDTSVLVAAFYEVHPHHAASLSLLKSCRGDRAFMAAHSVAEVYSRLTGGPRGLRVNGDNARLYLDSLRGALSRVALTAEEYEQAISEAADRNLAGAVIYDLLIARCARKAGANVLYTWNVRDFARLGPEMAGMARTP